MNRRKIWKLKEVGVREQLDECSVRSCCKCEEVL